MSEEERMVQVAVEALPFPLSHDIDKVWRAWVWPNVHGVDVPLTDATIDYCEKAFQWIKKGKPKSKPALKVVK